MREEISNLFDTAFGVVLVAATLLIAVMFLNQRHAYANVVLQNQENTYSLKQTMATLAYDGQLLTGTQAIECVTHFYSSAPVYVDREYDPTIAVPASTYRANTLYTPATAKADPTLLKLGLSQADSIGTGLTTRFLPDDRYIALFYRGMRLSSDDMSALISRLNAPTGLSDDKQRAEQVRSRFDKLTNVTYTSDDESVFYANVSDEITAVILVCISKSNAPNDSYTYDVR